MENNDFSILIKTILDNSGINTDLQKIQEIVKKYHVELIPDLQTASLRNQFKAVCQEMANDFNKSFGTNVTGNDMFNVYENKAKQLEQTLERINKIKLLSNGGIKNDYATQLAKLEGSFSRIGLKEDEIKNKTSGVTTAFKNLKERLSKPFNESNYQEIISLNDKLQQEFIKSSNEATRLNATMKMATDSSRLNNAKTMQTWADNNSKAMSKYGTRINEIIAKMGDLNVSMSKVESDKLVNEFKQIQNAARQTGNIGKTAIDKIKTAWEKFGGWSLATGTLMAGWSKIKDSISELKEIDNILTEISKTSDRTAESLKQLGNDSFETASDYGRKASDYLTSVQEMNRSGFYDEKGNAMAEQSLLAQSAGDMTEEIADKWILAVNAAYKYKGEAQKINAVLDGTNEITNRNSVNMTDMAEAMSTVGTSASQAGIKVNELSAIIGTSVATTKKEGSEVGTGWKAILVNLQNISSDKIRGTLDKAKASMTEMVNGVEKLKNPTEILKELAKTYNSLDAKDPLKAEITQNIGGKHHANILSAFLTNYDQYSKMLDDYASGEGSAFEEAQKSANNWSGTLNKVNNNITDIVNSLVNADTVISGMNGFNDLLSIIKEITSSSNKLILTLGTIGITIAQQKSQSGGLIRLINLINNSPFLATVEFSSDVYELC